MDAPVTDPVAAIRAKQSAGGKKGMRNRWGPPKTLDLRDLAPEQRAFIEELVAVVRRNSPPADSAGQE